MKNRIRVESHENVVTNAKIYYVPDDGDEVDISRCIQGVDLHLTIGEVSRATPHTILVDGHVTAEIEDVIVRRLGPPRHFRRTRRVWHRGIRALKAWIARALKAWIARSLRDEVRREIARTARQRRRV